jgi:hypothetical protein
VGQGQRQCGRESDPLRRASGLTRFPTER